MNRFKQVHLDINLISRTIITLVHHELSLSLKFSDNSRTQVQIMDNCVQFMSLMIAMIMRALDLNDPTTLVVDDDNCRRAEIMELMTI